jgi:hypothetical protein
LFWDNNTVAMANHPVNRQCLSALPTADCPMPEHLSLALTATCDYSLIYHHQPKPQPKPEDRQDRQDRPMSPVALHDLAGAQKEAEVLVKRHLTPGFSRLHLVFGIGLGYLVEAVASNSLGTLVIYEPNLDILHFTLHQVDLSQYLIQQRILLVLTPNALIEAIHRNLSCENALDILVTQGYALLLNTDIQEIMPRIVSTVQHRIQELKTGQYFHTQWIQQFCQNIPYIVTSCNLFSHFPDCATRLPALVIGRGPSLDVALDDIRRLAPSMLLIATGSSLHRLYEAGITPDFAVFYDANGLTEQLANLPEAYLRSVHVLFSPVVSQAISRFRFKQQTVYWTEATQPLADWFFGSPQQTLAGGGTVSLIALQVALAWQCNPVVLVGQDLSFPNNTVYAGGILLKQDEQGRMNLESSPTLYTMPEAMDTVTGWSGEELPALKAYTGFIKAFEQLAAQHDSLENPVRLLNASVGGAQINGYSNTSLRQFADAYLNPEKTLEAIASSTNRKELMSHQTGITQDCPVSLLEARQKQQQLQALLEQTVTSFLAAQEQTRQTSWENNRATYQSILVYLEQHPVIAYCLLFQSLTLKKNLVPVPATLAEQQKTEQAFAHFLEQGIEYCQNTLLPIL